MRRFLVGLVIASIAAATPIGALAGDKEIAQHILQKIEAEKKAGKLRGFDVNLRVEEGHVWLTGQVASKQQMQLLSQIASHTSHLGTKQVHKQLRVETVERPVAETAKKSSRFPNFLAVFNREEKKEEASEPAVRRAMPNNAAPARKNSTPQVVSSRRTYQRTPIAPNTTQTSGLKKRRTSHDVDNQTASLPTRAARPSRELSVAKAAPTNRTTPLPVARRPVAFAGGEIHSVSVPTPVVQQVANNQEQVKPTQAAITPAAPAPIPRNDAEAAAAQLSKLSPQQLAALYQQLQFAQMQQARAEYARLASMNQTPVAFAPAGPAPDGMGSTPMAAPSYMPVSQGPAIHHDHPNMPAYAWPGYAAHPNYAAVTYPKQYSPSAWPYIGPFYPYPQVPLGWRKVQLEWDDGWWFLNFKNRHFR